MAVNQTLDSIRMKNCPAKRGLCTVNLAMSNRRWFVLDSPCTCPQSLYICEVVCHERSAPPHRSWSASLHCQRCCCWCQTQLLSFCSARWSVVWSVCSDTAGIWSVTSDFDMKTKRKKKRNYKPLFKMIYSFLFNFFFPLLK